MNGPPDECDVNHKAPLDVNNVPFDENCPDDANPHNINLTDSNSETSAEESEVDSFMKISLVR